MDAFLLNSIKLNLIFYPLVFAIGIVLVFFLKIALPELSRWVRSIKRKNLLLIVFMTMVIYTVIFGFLSIYRYDVFAVNIYDLGNMEQALWNTVHGDFMRMTTHYPAETRLAFHVEPIMLLVSAFYFLWQDPRLLLLLQTILLASGALAVFLLTERILKFEFIALLMAIAYLLNPALHQANLFDFHPLVFGTIFILYAFYFFLKEKYPLSLVLFLLAAFCREEIALMVFLFGLYLFFRQKKWGAIIGLCGLAWGLISLLIIIPNASPGGVPIQYALYEQLGNNPTEVITTLISNPFILLDYYSGLGRLNYVIFLLLPFAFLSLLSPWLLLTGIFSFGIIFIRDDLRLLMGIYHYHFALVGSLLLSALYGIKKLDDKFSHRFKDLALYTAIMIVLINMMLLFGHQSTSIKIDYFATKLSTAGQESARVAIKLIPTEASLTASWNLGPHAAGRHDLRTIDSPLSTNSDYILLGNVTNAPCHDQTLTYNINTPKTCEATPEQYQAYITALKKNENYQLIFDQNGILLFKRY
ncbi:MAG TPA: hypothetical protein DDW92_01490 [Candidatus Veblenbacteria bacterium]|nr:hypothetical protein [Candidatus Veblenbacteria bacterium]HBZ36392.1 hypothetical protein [Candidatus Veblenbacteria bacterium]HCX39319.1 hypothetical protein [Candidatus Veblenbacteria bacterium]